MTKFENIDSPSVERLRKQFGCVQRALSIQILGMSELLQEREERELYKEYLEANERLERQELIDLLTLGKEGATKKQSIKLERANEEMKQKRWLDRNKYTLLDVDQYLAVLSLLIPYKWRWIALLPLSILFIVVCYYIFHD